MSLKGDVTIYVPLTRGKEINDIKFDLHSLRPAGQPGKRPPCVP